VPTFGDSEAEGRAGVFEVGTVISKMKWIFREQPLPDTGIDCHIETRAENKKATGKLIGCQVKSGPRYRHEETPSGFVYRGDPEHLAYWLGHSLPVIIILRDEETGKCYWQVVNGKTATSTGKGWKIEVPKSQVLGEGSKEQLEQLADTGWARARPDIPLRPRSSSAARNPIHYLIMTKNFRDARTALQNCVTSWKTQTLLLRFSRAEGELGSPS